MPSHPATLSLSRRYRSTYLMDDSGWTHGFAMPSIVRNVYSTIPKTELSPLSDSCDGIDSPEGGRANKALAALRAKIIIPGPYQDAIAGIA